MAKTLRTLFLGMAVLLLLVSPALAELRQGSITLTPMLGYYLTNDYHDLDDGPMFGGAVGYQLTKTIGVEGFVGYAHLDRTRFYGVLDNADLWQMRLDGLYHFQPEERLVPYLAAGLGGNFVDYSFFGKDTDLMVNAGGGVKYFISEDWALRGDARGILADGTLHMLATAGLSFVFGGHQAAPAPVQPQALTPPPVPTQVAAAPAVLAEKPATASAPTMAAMPAAMPSDSDNDGVLDSIDACPNTPAGVAVDEFGCQLALVLMINFDFDKADIKPEFSKEIDKAAAFINKYPQAEKITIAGHTDSIGTGLYNQGLSERRAQAVANALENFYGVDKSRLIVRGYGETRPVADNKTAEGRYQNRRVEITCCGQSPQ